MRRFATPISAFLLLAAAAVLAHAQEARPTYEAASVKPNSSGGGNSSSKGSKGQIVFTPPGTLQLDALMDGCIDGSADTGTMKTKMNLSGSGTLPQAPGAVVSINSVVEQDLAQQELPKK